MSNLLNPDGVTLEQVDLETGEITDAPAEEAEGYSAIDALLEDFPEAPARELLETYKERFGSIHAYVPSAEELFLFRPLRRIEHRTMAGDIAQLSETEMAKVNPRFLEDQLHEKVVAACVFFPRGLTSAENLNMAPAGLFTTLFNLVMENSHFVAPERALAQCYRL